MQTMVVSEVKQTKICKHIQEMQVYYWWVYVYYSPPVSFPQSLLVSKTWGFAVLVTVSSNKTVIIKICLKKTNQTNKQT